MPCVLHHASKEEESKIIKHDSCPWIVRLRTSHNHTDDYVPLPPSFSPTLIVSLLSFKSFKIDKAGPHQYRNIFTLQFSYKGDVIIIERQLQLEVYYFFSNKECFSIRSDILEAILETKNRLSISDAVQIEESFPCSCTPHQIEQCQPRHTLHEPPRHILCQPDTPGGLPCAGCNLRRMECDLNDQQLRWLRVVQGRPLLSMLVLELNSIIGASVAVCPTACATACNLSKPLSELRVFCYYALNNSFHSQLLMT